MKVFHRVLPLLALPLLAAGLVGCSESHAKVKATTGQTNTYFVAADEIDWSYTPSGVDKMMNMPFMGIARILTEKGPHRIGTVYRKALYREYTDDTFRETPSRARRNGNTRARWG